MKTERNGYHLVDPSPWPLIMSTSIGMTATGAVMYMHSYGSGGVVLGLGIMFIGIAAGYWFRDIIREGTYEGNHTSIVQGGFRQGVILFIISEVLFFFGFFFAYFWLSFRGSVEVGSVYPPVGIESMNAWEIPLLNTLILLSSGASITWAHHSIVVGSRKEALGGLVLTVLLAIIFTGLQGYEYAHAGFKISDSVYGSTFYMLTGFHGLHVIVGTIMIGLTTLRVYNYEQTSQHHFGFELAAWYWHFVDVVWLFLFVIVYIWGS